MLQPFILTDPYPVPISPSLLATELVNWCSDNQQVNQKIFIR